MTAQLDDVRSGTEPAASPYRGLMPYTEADADYFFGREGEIVLIANNAQANRFGVLYGPSGVGKSSVLRAGVVRHIRDENRRRLERYGDLETVVAYLKEWRDDPDTALAAAIAAAFRDADGTVADIPPDDLVAATVRLCADKGVDLVVILDQFEEFSLYHRPEVVDFAEVLARLTAPVTNVNVLVAIREDALSWLDELEGIVPDVFANTLRLDHLDEDSARAAITEPLRRYNAQVPEDRRREIEPPLVEALLHEVQAGRVKVDQLAEATTGPGQQEAGGGVRIEAPYLQLVLTRLWDEEARLGSAVLRLSTLRELGGAQEIVRQHLDRVMREFTPPEMAVLADAFGHLVTPSGSKIAHRPSDLAELSGHDPAQVATLLHRLAEGDQRILRDVPPPMDEPHAEPRYEIFHDVLALAVLDWRRRFLAEAQSRREQAELLAEKERSEKVAREARNRLRKARALIAAMALLLVACVALAGWAVTSRSSAQDARERSERSEQKALRAERTSRLNEARSQLLTDPSAALAIAADFDVDATADPDGVLEAVLRQALDAADTDVDLRLGSPVVHASFAGKDSFVVVTEDGRVRVWDVESHDPVRLEEKPRLDVPVMATGGGRVVQASTAVKDRFVVALTDEGAASAIDLTSGEVGTLEDVGLGDGASLVVNDHGDRRRVLLWDLQRHLAVWDVAANRLVPSPAVGERLDSAALDVSGRTLAMVNGLTATVWDLRTGDKVAEHTFTSHLDPAQVPQTAVVAFSGRPGAAVVVVTGGRAEVSRWEYADDRVLPLGINLWWKRIYDAADVRVGDIDYLAVAGDKTVMLFDDNGVFQAQTDTANDVVVGVESSPTDSSVWAMSSADGYTELYRTNRYPPQPSWTYRGQPGPVRSLAFSPDGADVVTGSSDGSVRIWRVPDAKLQWFIPDRILSATFTPDGSYLFGLTPSGGVIREDRDGQLVSKYASLYGQAVDMSPSPDGHRAVVTDQYCTVPVQVALDSSAAATPLAAVRSSCPTVVVWNPDPSRHQIVAGTYENKLTAWNADTGARDGSVELGPVSSEVHSIAVSADGGTIIAGSGSGGSGSIHVVDADDLTESSSWATPDVDFLALSADGRYAVAAGNDDHRVTVWDVTKGELLTSFDQAVGTLNRVSISPDEDASRVAVSTSSGSVYVWDRASGRVLAVMHRHADAANHAVFDPQVEDQMFSAGDDGFMVSYTCEVCGLAADELQDAAEDRLPQRLDLTR